MIQYTLLKLENDLVSFRSVDHPAGSANEKKKKRFHAKFAT